MDTLKLLNEVGLQAVVMVLGLIGYRRLPLFFKLIWWQVIASVFNYSMGQLLAHYFKVNQATYNVYIVIEALLLVLAGFYVLKSTKFRQARMWLLLLIIVVFVGQVLISGIGTLANYALCIYSIMIAGVYLLVLFQAIDRRREEKHANAIILVGLGIVICFACNAPYWAMFNYLNETYMEISTLLYNYVLNPLSNLRYLMVALGFIVLIRRSPSYKEAT